MKLHPKAALLLTLSATFALAQEPRGETKVMVAGKVVAIEYGRPSLAGRDMLGKAVAGVPWRMGLGSPTSLKTEADLTFATATVPKGTYVLTAVKDDKGAWSLIASSPDGKTKTAEVPLKSTTVKTSAEQFTIELSGKDSAGEFAMTWGTLRMATSFTAK